MYRHHAHESPVIGARARTVATRSVAWYDTRRFTASTTSHSREPLNSVRGG
jgi:hypothetical protein